MENKSITPALIAQLRKLTRADMSDCRSALGEADGDIQRAVVLVRARQVVRLQEATAKSEAECQQALLAVDGDVDKATNRLRSIDAGEYVRQRIDELLAMSEPPEEVLEGILALIWRRDLTDMAPCERTVAMVGLLRNHIVYGGFQKYFFTIGERHLPETLQALTDVGAARTALFLNEAARVAQGERLDIDMEGLDATLNEEPEPLAPLAVEYVRARRDDFVRV